ncbi:MAG: hypothetical protein H7Y89_11075 [Steroidobacteraceae bacterium]|nr:hypothetical protein [Steroidobacteraceae bacterium]
MTLFPPDPGDWLLNPLPLALLCFGAAAFAARLARRHFEWVGAAVALACGLAVISLLQDETERLVDSARTYWLWLIAVTLLGVAGGSAARISEPVRLSTARLRFSVRVVLRMAAATLFGAAVMLAPAVLFAAAIEFDAGAAVGWLLSLSVVGGIAGGGWIVGRFAPRFPVVCAILSVFIPPVLAVAFFSRHGPLDGIVGVLAMLSVPAAVCAYIASTRSTRARARREQEAQGYSADLIRISAFGLFVAAMLTGVSSMTRETCGMQSETFAWRVFLVRNVASPQEAVDTLKESGLEARHVAGGVDDYRLEIDEPQSICNMFSRRTIIAQYPGVD